MVTCISAGMFLLFKFFLFCIRLMQHTICIDCQVFCVFFPLRTNPDFFANIVSVYSGASKQWAMEVKMNTAVRSHCFLDEMTLATSGVDADVYIWDLRKTGRCVAR